MYEFHLFTVSCFSINNIGDNPFECSMRNIIKIDFKVSQGTEILEMSWKEFL